jgi:hypothetical protein
VPDQLPRDPDYAGSFLIVLGVGLGWALPELLARTRARHLILVEPHGVFLHHALSTIDWEALLDGIEAEGGTVSLIVPADASQGLLELIAAIRRGPELCVDGSYLFVHYPAQLLLELRDRFAQYAEALFQTYGFYEDERLMLVNACVNLGLAEARLIPPQPAGERSDAVVIVGSGPSLDPALPELKRLAAGATVISCGTALKSLLRVGIVPDFHCESENVAHTVEILDHTAAEHALDGISLIASITVDPRVPGYFRDCLVYFREASCSTRLLAPGEELMFTSPTVANVALRCAVSLGFRTLYLVGVDFGVREAGRHHAEGSAYRTLAFLRDYDQSMRFPIPAPANFGGVVQTDATFSLGRLSAAKVAGAEGITVYNCSDGIQIEGAPPRRPGSVRLAPLRQTRAGLRAEIRAACPPLAEAVSAERRSLAAVRAEAPDYFAGLLAAIDAAAAENDLVRFWERLDPYLGPGAGREGVASLVVGSLRALPKLAGFLWMRERDPGRRLALYRHFVAAYRAAAAAMAADVQELLAGLTPAPDPEP